MRQFLCALALGTATACAQPPAPDDLDFHALLEPIPGRVILEGGKIRLDSPAILRVPQRHVWGASVVRGEDGRYHMFHVQIDAGSEARGFSDEWLFSSVVMHAVSEQPNRDFTPTSIVLGPGDESRWDAMGAHNPHVRVFDGEAYLYYIGSRDSGPQPPGTPGGGLSARSRIQQMQRVGVVHATSVLELAAGRFERPTEPILEPRTRVKDKDVLFPSAPGVTPLPDNLVVVNPAVVRAPDGEGFLLYFKGNLYDPNWRGVHGAARGPAPGGPFAALDCYLFDVRMPDGRLASAEDPYVWRDEERGRYYALVKDFSGRLTGADPGLALLTSVDGLDWAPARHPLASPKELRFADGTVLPVKRLERPQLLLDARGRPEVLYAACIVGDGYDGPTFNVHIRLQAD